MKKRALVIYTVLLGSLFMVGCSNQKDSPKNKPQENSTSKGDTGKNDPGLDKKDDAFSKGEITEEDIVSKTTVTFDGEEYVKYELKDGSVIIVKKDEDDLDKLNEAIKEADKEQNNQQPKKID